MFSQANHTPDVHFARTEEPRTNPFTTSNAQMERMPPTREICQHYKVLLFTPNQHSRIQNITTKITTKRMQRTTTCNQADLHNPDTAFTTQGIIYYKGNLNSRKGYVGKAMNLMARDRLHHTNAKKRIQDAPHLDRAIRRSHLSCNPKTGGWFLIPLEKIDPQTWSQTNPIGRQIQTRRQRFNAAALPIKQWWIRHLQTGHPISPLHPPFFPFPPFPPLFPFPLLFFPLPPPPLFFPFLACGDLWGPPGTSPGTWSVGSPGTLPPCLKRAHEQVGCLNSM